MKEYFGLGGRGEGGLTRGFFLIFLILLLPVGALWFFYRHLFQSDTSVLVPVFLSLVTAWIWAYLIGYGSDSHLEGD